MPEIDDEHLRLAKVEHTQRQHSQSIVTLWFFVVLLVIVALYLMWWPK